MTICDECTRSYHFNCTKRDCACTCHGEGVDTTAAAALMEKMRTPIEGDPAVVRRVCPVTDCEKWIQGASETQVELMIAEHLRNAHPEKDPEAVTSNPAWEGYQAVCKICGALVTGRDRVTAEDLLSDHVDLVHTPRTVVEEPTPLGEVQQRLWTWWLETAEADLTKMLPKVSEYTASDLVLMGHFLEEWTGMPKGSGTEAACAFYLLGKTARMVAAYREGRLPSDDTLHDAVVYAMMMRRIRESGSWPE